MWVTYLIAAAFFVAFMAMGYFAIQEREAQREREGDRLLAAVPLARPGTCPLCDAPLRRAASSDEVVFEVEHRIDAELRDIARLLLAAPHVQGQIFRA